MRHLTTILITLTILALAWLIPTTAQAATINYPMPGTGPHSANLDEAIITNERVFTQSGNTYHFRDVYLPDGTELLGQEYLDDGPEGAGWYSWLVNRRPAWDTTFYGQRLVPDVEPDRCATVRLPRYGWAKVIELRGRCRGIVRRARQIASRLEGTGQQTVGRWKCVASAGGAHCRMGRDYRHGRHVTLRRVSRSEVAEQRTARRRAVTRCGRAAKIGSVTVWTRGVSCRRMLDYGMDVAASMGLKESRPQLAGWDCGRHGPSWTCKRGRRLAMFSASRLSFNRIGVSVVSGPWGGAYVLTREP